MEVAAVEAASGVAVASGLAVASAGGGGGAEGTPGSGMSPSILRYFNTFSYTSADTQPCSCWDTGNPAKSNVRLSNYRCRRSSSSPPAKALDCTFSTMRKFILV